MNRKITLLLLLCTFVFVSCTFQRNLKPTLSASGERDNGVEKVEEPIKELEPVEINIVAVGDIMVHGPQLRAQYDPKKGIYDFKNNFQFVKKYIYNGDIALCNLETTFGGEEKGYSSYPRFNTPDALGEALKDTGFDVIVTSNNHTMDTGSEGVIRTAQVLKDFQLDIVGTKEKEEDEKFLIKEVKGVQLGIIAYTYETPPWGDFKTLNGQKIPKSLENRINTFNYDHLDEDLDRMKKEISKMKDKGAELIVFYLHWGNEYHRQPNPYQEKMAQALADFGVDVIFSSHPHVLQPIEWIQSEGQDQKTLVVYSMGNFLSNQRYEIMKKPFTEDGMIVNVTFKKKGEEKMALDHVAYIPIWVHRYTANNKRVYEILPLMDALNDPSNYSLLSEKSLSRAKNSLKNTSQLIEKDDIHQVLWHIGQERE